MTNQEPESTIGKVFAIAGKYVTNFFFFFFFFFSALVCLLISGCTGEVKGGVRGKAPAEAGTALANAVAEEPAFEDPVEYREQAARIAALMDDRLLAGQVLMTGIDGNVVLGETMEDLLRASPPGGIMLFKYNLDAEKDQVRFFLEACSALIAAAACPEPAPGGEMGAGPGIAPFIAVDHEGGQVFRFGPEVGRLPAAASFWETAQSAGRDYALHAVEEGAYRSGQEIRDLGITMNLAPVAEILDEENGLFLETRSYGPDPVFVEAAAAAFIQGMEAAGIACVVKHFPGNTGADPHSGRAVLSVDGEVLDRMVQPFASLIHRVKPPGMMVSHIVVPAWDGEHNASLSPRVIQDWLRGNLGFTGILLADDFSMGAVAVFDLSPEDAAVEALNAGIDMVMTWPRNLSAVHGAILAAVQEGRLPRERLRQAVEQILFEKIRYGLVPENNGW
ncbi:MAG: glycoside hydrolase family 3 protein [Treponema sp.]|nr:glycoside hydrolase family 3 protein [Treponema sp.]